MDGKRDVGCAVYVRPNEGGLGCPYQKLDSARSTGPDGESRARGVTNGDMKSSTAQKDQTERAETPWPRRTDPPERGKPTAGWLRRLPRVAMVQTTDLGKRNDLAATGRFHGPGIRRVLPESKVCPGSVVVAEIAS